jgi:periplasmic mercuric ion binding protein
MNGSRAPRSRTLKYSPGFHAAVLGVALAAGVSGACQSVRNQTEAANRTAAAVSMSAAGAKRTLQTAELMVESTSCASCSVTIRRHLHLLRGIGEIREGSTAQHLVVEFDPQLVTTEQLVQAVSDAGYEAEVWVHGPGAASG